MSALGQKQTWLSVNFHVRFTPKRTLLAQLECQPLAITDTRRNR
jgi:hypothetical protein